MLLVTGFIDYTNKTTKLYQQPLKTINTLITEGIFNRLLGFSFCSFLIFYTMDLKSI